LLRNLESTGKVKRRFTGPCFHEAAIELPIPASEVLPLMAEQGILGGYDLGLSFAALENCLLVNVTETKTEQDLALYSAALSNALEAKGC